MMTDMKQGRIIKGVGGLYSVLLDRDGKSGEEKTVVCRARGTLRYEMLTPTVGDRVSVAVDARENAVIFSIGERKSLLIRPALANLDTIFIVVPTAVPEPDYFTVDKLTAIAANAGINTVIIVSKCGLSESLASGTAELYRKCGFPVFVTDSVSGEGVGELRSYITENCTGKISAFAGASGVGKSTLISALFPGLSLGTGEVSLKTGRGRHTTRTVEIFVRDGFFIADTPGFTMLDFEQFDFFGLDVLASAFPEFRTYLGGCRYNNCTHTKEEGCSVLLAVKNGELPVSRHQSYLSLYPILKNKHKWGRH